MATLVITPEMEQDAKLLAQYTGKTPQEAAAEALRKQIQLMEPRKNPRGIDWKTVDTIVAALKGKIDYSQSEDQVLGYDEHGGLEQASLNGR